MTQHARERAAEMGVCTKRVKRLVRNPCLRRTDANGITLAISNADPEIAVVYADGPDGRPVVLTVLYRTYERYERHSDKESA